MGQTQSMLISHDDMQFVKDNPDHFVVINTLPHDDQQCVIHSTLSVEQEGKVINELLLRARGTRIVVYGRNDNDESVHIKASQLQKLGFRYVYIYPGGMFEWLLLQEIYGSENFPTIGKGEILDFQPPIRFKKKLEFVH